MTRPKRYPGLDAIRQEVLHAAPAEGENPRPVVVEYHPGSDIDIDLFATSNVWKTLDQTNLQITFTAPESGVVVVSLCGYLNTLAAGQVYWGLSDDPAYSSANAPVAQQLVRNATGKEIVRSEHRITGLTGGASYTYYWRGRTLAASSNQFLQIGSPSGRRAFMIATPAA